MAEKGKNLHFASNLSRESLSLIQEALDHPEKLVLRSNSAEPGPAEAKDHYKKYADTYALIRYQLGDKENALHFQEKALDGRLGEADANQRYVRYLRDLGKDDALLSFSAKAIIKGKSNDSLESDFKQVYLKKHKQQEWKHYLNTLQGQYTENLKKQLKGEMIKKMAPPFSLVNLKGEHVSLASLKGKVIVVDFWATWCGPCKASFPGMQRAVEYYKNASDVAFLFINTLERVEDREKVVKNFIASHEYTFNVLMDNESKKEEGRFDVVSAFAVLGIPTKFVLDKEGNIRFKTVGYNDAPDEELKKVIAMVEMLRAGIL